MTSEIFNQINTGISIHITKNARYKDIGELMKRCETLVVTRDEAKKKLEKLNKEIMTQEQKIGSFKEVQNEKILQLRLRFE